VSRRSDIGSAHCRQPPTNSSFLDRPVDAVGASERDAANIRDASWQVLATYNWEMRTMCGYLIDGYIGYRALSVDYSQGSGNTEYKYDVLMQGPVLGTTLHF
jgi:hypothetical protein